MPPEARWRTASSASAATSSTISNLNPFAAIAAFLAAIGADPFRARAGSSFLLPSPAAVSCHSPTTLSLTGYKIPAARARPSCPRGSAGVPGLEQWLIFADRAKVETEGAELAVEMGALHADALGQLSHLAVAEQELLLQIRALELLTGLP